MGRSLLRARTKYAAARSLRAAVSRSARRSSAAIAWSGHRGRTDTASPCAAMTRSPPSAGVAGAGATVNRIPSAHTFRPLVSFSLQAIARPNMAIAMDAGRFKAPIRYANNDQGRAFRIDLSEALRAPLALLQNVPRVR